MKAPGTVVFAPLACLAALTGCTTSSLDDTGYAVAGLVPGEVIVLDDETGMPARHRPSRK